MPTNVKPNQFNPDNVAMYEAKDGSIPDKYNELILNDVIQNSKIMSLAKYEEMDEQEKKFQYITKGPGAYWVGEGQKIETSKAEYLTATMRAYKLGVIIPVSREYLNYTASDFFEKMKPRIAEAFYKKFDEAVLLGGDNSPYKQSIMDSVKDSKKLIEGDLSYDNVLAVEDLITDDDLTPNAWISKVQNRSQLRNAIHSENGVVTDTMYDRSNNTIDGMPVVDIKSELVEKGTLVSGDFDSAFYGIPYNINYAISEDAQLSTLKNEDGTPVNLFEQELVALRATMDVAFMITNEKAFSAITAKKA